MSTYKMVVDVGKLCASLAGSAIEHRDRITAAMTEMWSDRLPEGQVLDLPTIQTCVAQDLRDIHTQLTTDSRQVNADLTEARKGRVSRDGSLVETREALFAARKMLDAIFGPGGADALFMQPNSQVEVDPAAVYEQATVVVHNLTDPDFVLPELRLDLGVDLTALAERIRVPAHQLGEALNELSLVNPKSHASLEAKDRSFGKLTKKALQGARLLEAFYAYAGHEGIASRTRRSSHRSRRDGEAARATTAANGDPPEVQGPDGPAPNGRKPLLKATSGSPPLAKSAPRPSPRPHHIPPAQEPAPRSAFPTAGAKPDIPPEASASEAATAEPSASGAPATHALPEKETAA